MLVAYKNRSQKKDKVIIVLCSHFIIYMIYTPDVSKERILLI